MKETPLPVTMTHRQRKVRRRNMVNLIRRGKSFAWVAAHYRVTEITVRNAVRDHQASK